MVKRDGTALGDAPTKTTAILFCGLASVNGEWMSRDYLESKLYPLSDPTARKSALRQALSRMRQWLGADSIESQHGCVRLVLITLRVDTQLDDKSLASFGLLAPGLSHPWMDELKSSWCKAQKHAPKWQISSFIESVCAIAAQDAVVGRSLLLGGVGIIDQVGAADIARMLQLTRPKRGDEPLAAEYALLQSHSAFRIGSFGEAESAAKRALRIAGRNKQSALASEIAAWMMFFSLERGALTEARRWLPEIESGNPSPAGRLFAINATVAYYWNLGEIREAVITLREGMKFVDRASRRQQLHFWSNASVFSAEAKDLRFAQEALEIAESLWIPEMDLALGKGIQLARIKVLTLAGEGAEAASLSKDEIAACHDQDFLVGGLYAAEAHAEALHAVGRTREASAVWRKSEARRGALGCRPTIRLNRQRAALI